MTSIYYNGIVLRDCETKLFEQDIEYDESGTDVLYSRFRIRVASTLTAYHSSPHFSTIHADGLPITDRAADMHARLSEARKDFYMILEGAPTSDETQFDPITGEPNNVASRVLLSASGTPEGTMLSHPETGTLVARVPLADCENGPSPKHVSVSQIFGGKAMRVEFEIVVCRKLCVPGFSDAMPSGLDAYQFLDGDNRVLSNRWSVSESRDEDWRTTKVLQGTLRVAHSAFWPHLMRGLCVPTLLNGYRRVRQSFVDDATNTVLKYRIEDRQEHAAPPPPAVTWRGHHAESTTENGTLQGAEVLIRLTGPTGVDKRQLIGAAGQMLVSRVQGLLPTRDANGKIVKSSVIMQQASVADVIHEPTIEIRIRVRYELQEYKWLGMRVLSMGQSLENLIYDPADPNPQPYTIAGYHPQVWPSPRPYDSESPSGVFSCYLQHPCSIWHDVPSEQLPGIGPVSNEDTDKPSPGSSGDPDSVFYLSPHVLPQDETDMTAGYDGHPTWDVYSFPYTLVEMENRYETDHGWAQLPLAGSVPAGQPSAALVRMHSPVCRRVLTMTASREGQPPMVPSLIDDGFDPNGIREVLAEDEIELLAPTLNPGGLGRKYAVRIMRTYLLERAPTASEKLRTGASPLDKLGAAEHEYDLSVFADTTGQLQSIATEPVA